MDSKFSMQGYYAILDVKGSSIDFPATVRHGAELLAALPCCLQIRGKELDAANLCRLAQALRPLCAKAGIPLCVNDRMDVALAVEADVVHLGQNDLPLAEALRLRTRLGAKRLSIGVSTHDLREAEAAALGGADYIGFGPVFPTQTKKDADSAVGLRCLHEVTAAVTIAVVAIGGITLDTVEAVARAGASAAAVIAAVDNAASCENAGRLIGRAFELARAARQKIGH